VLTAFGAHAAGFATARRCLRFLVTIFLISENSLKFANFLAEVTNSQSMHLDTMFMNAVYKLTLIE